MTRPRNLGVNSPTLETQIQRSHGRVSKSRKSTYKISRSILQLLGTRPTGFAGSVTKSRKSTFGISTSALRVLETRPARSPGAVIKFGKSTYNISGPTLRVLESRPTNLRMRLQSLRNRYTGFGGRPCRSWKPDVRNCDVGFPGSENLDRRFGGRVCNSWKPAYGTRRSSLEAPDSRLRISRFGSNRGAEPGPNDVRPTIESWEAHTAHAGSASPVPGYGAREPWIRRGAPGPSASGFPGSLLQCGLHRRAPAGPTHQRRTIRGGEPWTRDSSVPETGERFPAA